MKAIYLKDKDGNKIVTVPYYRVGDLFLTTIATNPSNYLGGTWELFGPGRCLVCVDTSDSNFNSVKKTGGANSSSYTPAGSNTGTAISVNQMPSHNHSFIRNGGTSNGIMVDTGSTGQWGSSIYQVAGGSYTAQPMAPSIGSTGGGQTHTHTFNGTAATISRLQKYITCYVWIRTA